jgi:glycosyltransferase involved in cell wall biosynthesis
VHTPSEYVADEVRDLFSAELRGSDRVTAIAWGAPAFSPSSPPRSTPLAEQLGDSPYVLAIGTIEPRKNIPRLVAAFGAVAAEHPDVRLVLAGAPGPDTDAVAEARERLDPEARRRVIVTGTVDEEQKQALLSRAHVFAYPSRYEGFGIPLLEAMAAGVPVVAARAGSIPEVAGGAAVLVEPTDEHELATAIARLLVDDDDRAALVNRGRARVVQFSWEQTARALAALYERLAA